jgi:uncharacterized protein YjfI (DUF2170 family)
MKGRKPDLPGRPHHAPPAETAEEARLRGAPAAKRWRDALKEQGFRKVELWVPADMVAQAKRIEQALRARAVIQASPHRGGPGTRQGGTRMSDTIEAPWTIRTLHQAFGAAEPVASGLMEVELVSGAEPTLRVTMVDHGNLPIYISVNGEQILVATLLWPVAEQKEAARFNEFLLRTHKMIPLSTFGITTVAGTDYYELFGSLSAFCSFDEVLTELRMLATNAIDAAELRDQQ